LGWFRISSHSIAPEHKLHFIELLNVPEPERQRCGPDERGLSLAKPFSTWIIQLGG
jgi:hypothetical protein